MRTIVHLDADAFFASVEQAADARLRGKPIAVGGETRGIVASASYEARKFGIYTPMPTARASSAFSSSGSSALWASTTARARRSASSSRSASFTLSPSRVLIGVPSSPRTLPKLACSRSTSSTRRQCGSLGLFAASTAVGVAGLAIEGALIEIEAYAVLG